MLVKVNTTDSPDALATHLGLGVGSVPVWNGRGPR
jgi:hypothetical protein